jgi:hypothetical protein
MLSGKSAAELPSPQLGGQSGELGLEKWIGYKAGYTEMNEGAGGTGGGQ